MKFTKPKTVPVETEEEILLQNAIHRNPKDPRTHRCYGHWLIEQDRMGEAASRLAIGRWFERDYWWVKGTEDWCLQYPEVKLPGNLKVTDLLGYRSGFTVNYKNSPHHPLLPVLRSREGIRELKWSCYEAMEQAIRLAILSSLENQSAR